MDDVEEYLDVQWWDWPIIAIVALLVVAVYGVIWCIEQITRLGQQRRIEFPPRG